MANTAYDLCEQYGPRSGPTECRSLSGANPLDTLIVVLKEYFEKVNLEKCQQTVKCLSNTMCRHMPQVLFGTNLTNY